MSSRTKAVAYIRVSTDKQASEGHSLEAQRAKIEGYCALYDIDLVGVEIDAGESASSLDRPALQRAFGLLRKGTANALEVVKIDRLTRSLADLQTVVEFFRSPKRALLSVTEQVDTRTAMGRGVLNIFASVGQLEREQVGERTSAAMRSMRDRGLYTGGGVPFGFRRDGDALVAVPAEQSLITEARALRAAGLAIRGVAATLSERGHRVSVGKVQRMLARAA